MPRNAFLVNYEWSKFARPLDDLNSPNIFPIKTSDTYALYTEDYTLCATL